MRYTCLHTVLLAVIFLLSCTRDPEVANNDPDAPQVELEILSRISAEVSIVSTVESSDITYGGEIIQIIDGEERGVKYSFTTESLDDNHRFSWLTENLQPNSTYVARAFITNGRNKKYSASKTYSTPSTSKPTLSSVTQDSESLVASIVDNGGRTIEDVGFVIGDTPDRKELMRKEKIPAAAQTKERFSLPLNSLPGGKTLYVIAYAIDNQEDTGYSSTPLEVFVPQPVTSIILNCEEMTLVEGTTAQIEADVQPENATDKSITWKSSDNEVATVEEGNVTAIKEGTAIITASAGEKSASCTVTVTKAFIPVSSISLNQTSLEMVKGEAVTLTATVEPEDATDKTVSWTSSNDEIITVENSGTVYAVGGGTARITAVAGEESAFCDIVVTVPVSEIKLNPTTCTLEEGQNITLYETILPEDATDKTVTWKSSDVEVATVEEGKVTAIKEGTAIITATAGEKSASCTVSVAKAVIPVSSISLSQTTLEMVTGETATLTASIEPEDATDKTISWGSSDDEVATVEDGIITAIKEGTATITASAGEKSATCTVTVNKKVIAVTSVTLDLTTLSLTEGETSTLVATVLPTDATDKTVTWSSSDSSVAAVSDGTVTAIKEGTSTITASAGEKSASCTVTVNKKVIAVTSVTLDQTALFLTEGETSSLVATVLPTDATDKNVTWSSSDSSVATVSEGTVTAIKEGTATITASAGEKSATCAVTVNKKVIAVTSITLDKTELSLTEEESSTLVATVLPMDATDKTVMWNSSDSSVASVSDGTVTAIKEGTATITASAGEKSASCTVTVNKKVIAVTSVTLDQTTLSLTEGETSTLMATVLPTDATDKTVTWSSSDSSVASVSDGTVTAIKEGAATIIASAGGKSATCNVTVTAAPEAGIPITSEYFPDEAFREYILSNFDTNLDGILSRQEVVAISGISIANREDIYSLRGIEYLDHLTSLSCYRSSITSLDVSNCTQLEYLNCDDTQISALDLSKCSQLLHILCERTQISSLDVSGCPLLEVLSCQYSPISFLNVSNCTQLTRLYSSFTQLSSLDVSGCPLLEELSCQYSPISSLNLLNCSNLKRLIIDETQISFLDVSRFPLLEDLWCQHTPISSLDLSNCTKLTELYCSNTQLSSLDVSNCTKLTELDCYGTQISSLDVSNCTQLKKLRCIKTPITSLSASNCIELKQLECYETEISSLDVSNCTKLTELCCSNTQLSSLDVSNCTKLTDLRCSNTQLSSLDVSNCSQLRILICSYTYIPSLDVSNCTQLEWLTCGGTQISSLDVSSCTKLTELYCNYTQISTLDVSNCSQLMKLGCWSTQISSLDLRNNVNLQTLICDSCPNLTDIWLIAGHGYETLEYDSDVATLHYE